MKKRLGIAGQGTVRATLEGAVETVRGLDGNHVSISVRVPVRPVHSFAPLDDKPGIIWIPGSQASPAANRWASAGWGMATILESAGDGRFGRIRESAAAFLANIRHLVDGGLVEFPALRFYGGGAFAAKQPGAMWSSFPETGFFMPRWNYYQNGTIGVLRFTGSKAEFVAGEQWPQEAAAADAWLASGGVVQNGEQAKVEVTHELADWEKLVHGAIGSIASGEMEKVVISRMSELTSSEPLSIARILRNHEPHYSRCVRFAVRFGDGIFTGVTPEQLVTVHGDGCMVEADALAGSIPRDMAGSDEASVEKLMSSYKNRREFEYVLNDLVGRLGEKGVRVNDHVPMKVKSLKNVHHLHSRIVGTAAAPVHVLELLDLLHPTPAVCGTPTEAAASWLAENEDWDRGWYAGPVGWFDENGEGDFAVSIRSALVQGTGAKVFAGCGIVNGSEPLLEYEETRIKQLAMLHAMGGK